ncbi:MAG: radical SAM protein [Nanoarchaeota archaeon]
MNNTNREIIYEEIKVDKVLNINEHADGGWFWTKYSAAPYLGCQYACSYCFLRGDMYGLTIKNEKTKNLEDPFSQFIRVRINAPEILDKELSNLPKDIIVVGDYQPIESKYKLSRKMLEVCLKHEFPTIIIAKSPLVIRDLEIIKKINAKSWACVVFSINSEDSGKYRNAFETFASSLESRFNIMKQFADAGIYTGIALIPIMPFINDSEENLKNLVKKTKENNGKFVLAGGLVFLKGQEDFFYNSLEKFDKNLVEKYKDLYKDNYSPKDNSWAIIGRKIKSFCKQYKIDYRIKRFIPKSPLSINKEISEKLFLKVYEMEINEESEEMIKKYRELAFKIDELDVPLNNLFKTEIINSFLNKNQIDNEVLNNYFRIL